MDKIKKAKSKVKSPLTEQLHELVHKYDRLLDYLAMWPLVRRSNGPSGPAEVDPFPSGTPLKHPRLQ